MVQVGLGGTLAKLRTTPRTVLGQAFEGLTIRRLLLLGFAVLFVPWLASGYELVRRLGEVEAHAADIHSRFLGTEQLLFTLRAEVLLGSVYLRDALLDTGPGTARFYQDQLRTSRAEIERALQDYVPAIDSPTEREHWAQLQIELGHYWDSMMPVLGFERTPSPTEARALLHDRVIPRRQTIIHISDRIRALNQEAFQEEQAQLAQLHHDMRRRVWLTSGLALALGLGIAFLATRYAGRLERRIRQQHAWELQNKRELERLAAQLVGAQEEERRRIARELHDEVGQALNAIKLELAIAQPHLEASAKGAALTEARSITDRALQTVRDLSQLLHPAMLDDLGLPDTLDWYLRSFSRRTGIRAQLVLDRMENRVTPELEVCAYRIIQEALTNVAKHAEARTCRVYLQRLPHSLLITVEDDGKGFDPPAVTRGSRGLGLVGLRERASAAGGTLRLESAMGKGTRLTFELPILREAAGEEDREAAETHLSSPPLSGD